jgi:exopolyphosphatase/guanosine-5'-triphosphate,3'-diphosphate pyrophosphatase
VIEYDDGQTPSASGASTGELRPEPAAERKGGKWAPEAHADAAGQGPNAQKQNRKRRRKRRRGRRVFAQDTNSSHKQAPDGARQLNGLDAPHERSGGRPLRRTSGQGNRPSDAKIGKRNQSRPIAQRGPVYAALDLGTNNCRLLVAVPTRPGQFRVIDAFSRIVRLGEGLSVTGRLGEAAMDRAIEALKICRNKLDNREIRSSRLIATEACRSAENGREFLDRVLQETRLQLEIVDRATEARLAVSGCGTLLEHDTKAAVLFDIGGGSSEIALVDLSRRRTPRLAEQIVSWTSLPVGVVSLAEKHGGRDVSEESFDRMIADVRHMLDNFEGAERLAGFAGGPGFHLLGTSGTVTTLAGVHLELPRYDRRRVDGIWLTSNEVSTTTKRLLSWSYEQRVANACIGADRADLVLAGCAILEAIREKWPAERLRVADRGLREGILTELMSRDGVWRRRGHRRHNAK